jgi:hypothetical protein
MAELQRKIKPALKRLLVERAGGKCANPGCTNWRVHVHHIKHWAVYKAHSETDMIAICPSCHDASHHGSLKIPDELLYEWKSIVRSETPSSAHIYVEPASQLKILTGSIAISTTNDQAVVFELSNMNHLSFRVIDRDLLQLNARLLDSSGTEFCRVIQNNVRVPKGKDIAFEHRPGRARVTLPIASGFVPEWMLSQVRTHVPGFATDGRVPVLDVQVRKPGLVQVQGCWPDGDVGVVIADAALSFCVWGRPNPTTLVGEGEHSVLVYTGPVTQQSSLEGAQRNRESSEPASPKPPTPLYRFGWFWGVHETSGLD